MACSKTPAGARTSSASTEFYSDYGVYDVRITVPRGWTVGATGRERQRLDTPTGKTTHRYVQEDVHDFAWTTSPDYIERRERFEHAGLLAVDMRLLLQPEHERQAGRHLAAVHVRRSMRGQWYGPYPRSPSRSSIRVAERGRRQMRSSPPGRSGWRRQAQAHRKA